MLSSVFGRPFGAWHPPAHWIRWAGTLEDDADERQPWVVTPSDDGSYVTAVADIEGLALPALAAHLKDETLRDEWLEERDLWLPPLVQASYLLVLLESLGPRRRVLGAVERLGGLLRAADPQAADYLAVAAGLRRTGAAHLVGKS